MINILSQNTTNPTWGVLLCVLICLFVGFRMGQYWESEQIGLRLKKAETPELEEHIRKHKQHEQDSNNAGRRGGGYPAPWIAWGFRGCPICDKPKNLNKIFISAVPPPPTTKSVLYTVHEGTAPSYNPPPTPPSS